MIERAFGGLEVRFYADFKMIVTSQIKRQLLSPKGTETKATFFSTFPLWSTTTEVADWKASKEKRFPLKRYFSSGFFFLCTRLNPSNWWSRRRTFLRLFSSELSNTFEHSYHILEISDIAVLARKFISTHLKIFIFKCKEKRDILG